MPGGIFERFIQLVEDSASSSCQQLPDPIRKPYRIETAFLKAGAGKATVHRDAPWRRKSQTYLKWRRDRLWLEGRNASRRSAPRHIPYAKCMKRGELSRKFRWSIYTVEGISSWQPPSNLDMMAFDIRGGLNFLPEL